LDKAIIWFSVKVLLYILTLAILPTNPCSKEIFVFASAPIVNLTFELFEKPMFPVLLAE
jgi:hypothetical protein